MAISYFHCLLWVDVELCGMRTSSHYPQCMALFTVRSTDTPTMLATVVLMFMHVDM